MFFKNNDQKSLYLSKKGQELIEHYKEMVKNGYKRKDGLEVKNTYQSFELKNFKEVILPEFNKLKIRTLLDYGGGGSDWEKNDFHNNQSATEYFNLEKVINFEPARMKNDLGESDCVVCFDVLEHIYFNDLNFVLHNIYSNAKKLVVLQIACYEAAALLPSGENAHVTVRPPLWWKGFVDSFSIKFPKIKTMLFCSSSYKQAHLFKIWKAEDYDENNNYTVKIE
tara:strand:+ start:387 stop:1058 length:672 start_codon:yes stop_codon:yes gene_type:complete